MAETVVGSTLVRRRSGRVVTAGLVLLAAAVLGWLGTVRLAATAAGGAVAVWIAALVLASVSLWLTVLAVRALRSRVELSPEIVRVHALTGRRAVGWDDVVAVGVARPYFGLFGAMPVLRLRDHRAVAVDALSGPSAAGVAVDRDRIAQYRSLPGLPAAIALPPATGPAGAVSGGELRVPWGGLSALPNEPAVVARVAATRVLRPLCWLVGVVALIVTVVAIAAGHWGGAGVGGAIVLACLAVWIVLTFVVTPPSTLTADEWRRRAGATGSALTGSLTWPGAVVAVEEAVNLWGTRFLGRLVVTPAAGAPVALPETWRPVADAHALAQVARSY